jgi:hypothetical protein
MGETGGNKPRGPDVYVNGNQIMSLNRLGTERIGKVYFG